MHIAAFHNDVANCKLQLVASAVSTRRFVASKATTVCGRHHISFSRNGAVRDLGLTEVHLTFKIYEIAGFQQAAETEFLSFFFVVFLPDFPSRLAKSVPCTLGLLHRTKADHPLW